MGIETLLLFVLLALLAEVIGTVGGFGSSLLFVPLAGFFFDFHSVLGITALFHLSSNLSKITMFRKGIDKKLILTLGIPSVVFVAAGAYLSKFADSRILEIVLAVFLIGLSLILFIFKQWVIKPSTLNSVIGGGLSGLTAGLLGTGGAIRGLTLAAFDLEKNVFIATSAIIDLGIDATRTVVYTLNGYVHKDDFYTVLILLVVGFVGTYLGKKVLERFSQEQFKSVVLILILLIGLTTLGKQVWDMI
jgi:uncharacterized membrane protein YfcA